MKGKSENCKLKKHEHKKMQSEVYEKLDEESHKMATMQYRTKESSINYRSKRTDGGNWGLPVESDKCRICRQAK